MRMDWLSLPVLVTEKKKNAVLLRMHFGRLKKQDAFCWIGRQSWTK